MRPGGPSIGMFNASFALIVCTVRTSVRYRKPCFRTTVKNFGALPELTPGQVSQVCHQKYFCCWYKAPECHLLCVW